MRPEVLGVVVIAPPMSQRSAKGRQGAVLSGGQLWRFR